MRIPKELRHMKMKDVNTMWGGNWGATLQKLRQLAIEEREGEKEMDVVIQVEKMRKRFVMNGRTLARPSLTSDRSLRLCSKEDQMSQEAGPSKRTGEVILVVDKMATSERITALNSSRSCFSTGDRDSSRRSCAQAHGQESHNYAAQTYNPQSCGFCSSVVSRACSTSEANRLIPIHGLVRSCLT